MKRIIQTFIVTTCAAVQMYAAIDPRGVWFDPTGTALASNGATGTLSNPLGGSGTAFDDNMRYLCAGAGGSPTYPNLVIHLKAGTYETTGWVYNNNFDAVGNTAWLLRAGQRLVGEGIDRTIIKRINPNNDLYYVVGSRWGEKNVEVTDLTVDGNYWASADTTISVGGLNMKNLGRVRGVKVTGTSGNTSAGSNYEFFTLRMSGTTLANAVDRTATGGLIENCEVSNVRDGYINGIMPGAGQIQIVNNRVFMPHYTSGTGSMGINIGDSVNSIVMGNVVSGGFRGLYNDTGVVSNITIMGNQFHDCIRGIEFVRHPINSPSEIVNDLHITDNIIHMSTDSNVAENRYGILLHNLGSSPITRPQIKDNIIKGGVSPSTTWGLLLYEVGYPECYDNRLHNINNINSPSYTLQTDFQTVGGRIYNLFNHQGAVVSPEKWLSPRSSDWLNRKTIPSTDPNASYAVQVGDNFIGLQKSGFTVTLPTAFGYAGKEIVIVNETGATLTGSILNCSVAGQTINGAASVSLAAPYTSVRVTSNGSNWIRF
jgi:hypothetical protein